MLFALIPLAAGRRGGAQALVNFGQPSTWTDEHSDSGYGDVAAWYAEDGIDEQGHK